METSERSAWDDWGASQLKIVLLGGRNSGKSSLGNLILGKEEFVPKERTLCSRRLGVVAGRRLTVVDAPGWWCDFSAQDTPELVKREILSSVSLCSPGPHVFLITVKASSAFSEKRRRAVEEHVALLGERAWRHCMVVLLSTDGCKHTEESKELRWLTERCGRRIHAVSLRGDASELLQRIQRVVTENGNRVFEMQEEVLRAAAEETRRVEAKAQQRFMRVKKHRALVRGWLRPITDVRIVLLGAKGSGKTSTLNTILSRASSRDPRRTARCAVARGLVFGRRLTLVDTPGWWTNFFCEETPVFDRREMALSLSLCPPGPHVFLLVVRVDRAFTETYRRAVEEHLQLLTEHVWSRVMVLFSFGDWLGGAAAERCIESEGEPLRWLVERCCNRYHVLNNKATGDGFQVRELIRKMEEMLAGRDAGWHYEIEREALEEMEGRMRREEERAKERLVKKEERRRAARSQLEKLRPLPELRIVLLGGRKSGKSSCGNTILSRESFPTETQTTSCSEGRAQISSRTVAVLDTPAGFSVTSDLLVPSCALLLVVNASSSFKEAHAEALEKQLEAGGGPAWSRAAVLFSHGDWLGGDTSIEQRVESEGRPLGRLLERCGNRYHVLDNRRGGGGAQAAELMEVVEEMLAEGRLGGDHMWRGVPSGGEQDATTPRSCRDQLTDGLSESAGCSAPTPLKRSGDRGQVVAGRRHTGLAILDGDRSWLAFTPSAKRRPKWTITLPVWFPSDDLRLSGELLLLPPTRPDKLASPRTHRRVFEEENLISSLIHPALRERTLQRLSGSGGLQALIDRWDRSSLQELEGFIDSYFETVWEQTMGSSEQTMGSSEQTMGSSEQTMGSSEQTMGSSEQTMGSSEQTMGSSEQTMGSSEQTMGSSEPTEPERPAEDQHAEAAREEVLSSIDRRLSKLELLEEIRRDLSELRSSLEHSWRVIEELRGKQDEADMS